MPLFAPPIDEAKRRKLEDDLARATADCAEDPGDADRIIWLGRRTAYLGRFRDAIEIYTRGIESHPDNFRLYRHRGHRYITVREIRRAIADLERATELIRGVPDEIEPDGEPNARNAPVSTSHFNIWYHLGLAYYLKGDFLNALRCYRACMSYSTGNDDRLCATSDWLWMTLRRLDRMDEAAQALEAIRNDVDVIENVAYRDRLFLYKGEKTPEELLAAATDDSVNAVTLAYGVGNWHLVNGRIEQAKALFERIVKGPTWPAFGFIAAEAELARMK